MLKPTPEFSIDTLNNLVQPPKGELTLLDVVLARIKELEDKQQKKDTNQLEMPF